MVITEPLVLEFYICKIEGDRCTEEIRTLESVPFTGTINQNRGSYVSHLIWDLKDSTGALVPKGEYYISAKLQSTTAYGYLAGNPHQQSELEIIPNMASAIGFDVK